MRLPLALQRFNTANLRLRLISSAIMGPIALLGVYLGGLAYGAMITCAVTLGLYEWLHLVAPKAHTRTVAVACGLLIVLMAGGYLFSPTLGAILGGLFTVSLFVVAIRNQEENVGWIACGIPYMGASGLALLALRAIPGHGMGLVFFLAAIVWGTDIGAYAAGRLIGGPKLAPSISPSKTWAGLFGGIALAVILGYFAASLLGARHPAVALLLSPLLAVVSQIGDLFESYFKRRSDVKESGDLIPGHGGVLDRIDGLVFAGIFAFLFQAVLGEQLNWW